MSNGLSAPADWWTGLVVVAFERFDVSVVWLTNALVSTSTDRFELALQVGLGAPYPLAAAVLVALWFSPRGSGERHPGRRIEQPIFRQSRRAALLLLVGAAVALTVAEAIEQAVPRLRPFATGGLNLRIPLNPAEWAGLTAPLSHVSALPSHLAALMAVTAVTAFVTGRTIGWSLVALNFGLALLWIGTGLMWPTDVLAGWCLGALIGVVAWLLSRVPQRPLDRIVALFEQYPAAAYPVGFLLLLDLANRFFALFALASAITGRRIGY